MFSHIHVKSVKRIQLECRPSEQNIDSADLCSCSVYAAKTVHPKHSSCGCCIVARFLIFLIERFKQM